MADTTADPPRSNWLISTRGQAQNLYALAIVDKDFADLTAPMSVSTLSGAVAKSQEIGGLEVVFKMNPKTLDLEEPASVSITPTQDGGQFIEHQGCIYKNVSITGTTGLRPNRKGTQLIPVFGIPNPLAAADVNPETQLPNGEKTGFDDLIELRNLFRKYFDLKADPATSHKAVMVWQNGKEGEFYVVEPQVFRARRQSGSPLTTDYEIQLRTIGRVDYHFFLKKDPRQERSAIHRLNERLTEATRVMTSAFSTLTALVDRTVGVGQATVNNIMSPARAVMDGLTATVTSGSRALAVPRNSIALLAGSALEFMESLNVQQGELNAYKQFGMATQLSAVLHAYKQIFRVSSRLVAEDALFSRSLTAVVSARSRAYLNPTTGLRPPRSGGSRTNVALAASGSATRMARVMGGDNIYTVAQRLLGDQARWKELVIINDLKPPYISPAGNGKTILRPGDDILFPSESATQTSGITPTINEKPDIFVQRLGRDLRLRADASAGAIDVFDLVLDRHGDLARISGMPNLEQAIHIKFSTEQGTLPTHPTFGIKAPIGTKALLRSMIGFQLNARATLLSDSRIRSVRKLNINSEGNTVTVKADIEVADIDRTVSVGFEARR